MRAGRGEDRCGGKVTVAFLFDIHVFDSNVTSPNTTIIFPLYGRMGRGNGKVWVLKG